MSKLLTIFYGVDTHELVELAIKQAKSLKTLDSTSILLIDNGSEEPYGDMGQDYTVRYEETVGPNQLFHHWRSPPMKAGYPDWNPLAISHEYLAFMHVDALMAEEGWDAKTVTAFEVAPKLGLLGYVGSNQIDRLGGRGSGTMSNFAGLNWGKFGQASPAERHGARITGYRPAAVLDHCVMIARRRAMYDTRIVWEEDPPFHFYDKYLSCEMLRNNWHVGCLGVRFDHLSGGIRGGVKLAEEMRDRWLKKVGLEKDPAHHSNDTTVYEAAQAWFREEFQGFYPLMVNLDHNIMRPYGKG